MKVKVAQLCPTICSPTDCSTPGSSVHGILRCRQISFFFFLNHLSHQGSPENTGVGCHSFLLGIFPAQGSNPGLPQCRRSFTIWVVKNLPAMKELQEAWLQSLHWEDPLEEGMATHSSITHSSILAWRIPWTEEPVLVMLQSMGVGKELDTTWRPNNSMCTCNWITAVPLKLTQHWKSATVPKKEKFSEFSSSQFNPFSLLLSLGYFWKFWFKMLR